MNLCKITVAHISDNKIIEIFSRNNYIKLNSLNFTLLEGIYFFLNSN